MKINRILHVQLIVLLALTGALLAGCGPREAGSNRNEGMDSIRVVLTSQITDNIAKAVNDQIVGDDQGM